jgi:hypothetical protein
MSVHLRRRNPSGRRRPRRADWRRLVASLALAALVFPSLGALPWVGVDSVAGDVVEHRHHGATAGEAREAAHERAGHHDHGVSDIPGSPLHPVDHDCFPCQVLAALSRCALLPPSIPVVAAVPPQPPRPPPVIAPRVTVLATVLPPVRAPPADNA